MVVIAGELPEGFDTMVMISGRSSKFQVGLRKEFCDVVVYSTHTNGRIGFNFPTKNGAIMLAGGKDSQLDSEHYVLIVDRIRFNDGHVDTAYDATGRCDMEGSKDGRFVRKLTCTATNGVEKIDVDFVGGKKPVKVVHNTK
jgi:hypothetical protein